MTRLLRTATTLVAAVLFASGLALAADPLAADPPGTSVAPSGNPSVDVVTSMGTFRIELFPDRAPVTVANFLRYVDEDFYAGTIFHRVIQGVLIHGGGFTADVQGKETYPPIDNEADNGLMNDRWTVAAERTMRIHSTTSQFFVNLFDNTLYNHRGPQPTMYGFTVFGRVTEGRDVVTDISRVRTVVRPPHQKLPVEPVLIETIRRVD